MGVKKAKTLGKKLLEYVKEHKECFHEFDFFESIDMDPAKGLTEHINDPDFMTFLMRAQHTIGRRVLAQIMKGKTSAALERYMRFRMYDYNEFLQECNRQEWKDRKAAEMAKADEAIDTLTEFMKEL